MGDTKESNKSFDPYETWKGMRDASLDAWSKSMIDAVNTEAYSKASGAMLDTYLTASLPFREMLERAMLHALEQLCMPTREDFISLADRLTNIEMRLDDLDAKLDRLEVRQPQPPKPPQAAESKDGKDSKERKQP